MTDLALEWMRHGEAGGLVVEEHTPAELQELLNVSFPRGDEASVSEGFAPQRNGNDNGDADQGIDRVLSATRTILRYSVNHWTEGRFAAKLYSSTDAAGLATELLLATLNANAHVYSAAPALSVIEVATVRKLNDLIGFGPESSGLTMPGGSASNRLSLTTALNYFFPSLRQEGIASLPQPPVILTSEHSHYSVEQAAISAGIGLCNVWKVATDDVGRMDVRDLQQRLDECVKAGKRPFYINATSGTTVTGCFDDIRAISAVAKSYNCWVHVDGSWGGSVMFSSKYRMLLDGIEQAHSMTVNPHKGLRVPLQCSFLLVRDRKLLSANVVDGDYLFHEGQQYDIGATTTFCGRRSEALKLYMAWQMHGSSGLAQMIDDALDSGRVIRQKIREHPNLQLILPKGENIPAYSVCFRFCSTRAAKTPSPRLMVRPIHAEVSKRGHVMVDFAPIRVRARAVLPPSGEEVGFSRSESDGQTSELHHDDADENGFIGEVFRLPLHPYGLSAGLLILEEIVKVGSDLFGA
ncbi:unnamed protein product [Tilletia laevis]|nr:hypothetical protein CF328_g1667 [Tilletia controversa]CAD6905175.1 unnamed protein product [Tilletia laevis]CAD7059777.1 unnamed protein product [Tilletia caries]